MSNSKKLPVNVDQLSALLKQTVEKIQLDEDPAELNEYRAIFKKNVPFHLRNYVAGYLASTMCASSNNYSSSSYRKNRNERNDRNYRSGDYNATRERNSGDYSTTYERNFSSDSDSESFQVPKAARVVIPAGESKTIFIGMGRNRHLFPKDLVGMISQVCNLPRDRIGSINVHDAFSFVELYKEDADNVIQTLNGYEYRGKKLVVNYAKKSDDSTKVTENENTAEASSTETLL